MESGGRRGGHSTERTSDGDKVLQQRSEVLSCIACAPSVVGTSVPPSIALARCQVKVGCNNEMNRVNGERGRRDKEEEEEEEEREPNWGAREGADTELPTTTAKQMPRGAERASINLKNKERRFELLRTTKAGSGISESWRWNRSPIST